MTTRERTHFLGRAEPLDASLRRKSLSDRAHVLLFGAIGWPWLLRSLHGGSRAARLGLAERLQLPAEALPHLGGWKADAGFLRLLAETILERRPGTVVEFGAGATTLVAARALKMAGGGALFSFDQYPDYVVSVRSWLQDYGLDAEMREAPLTRRVAGWPGRWYDHGPLPERIDLLIVDGPHWAVHPYGRGAAEALFDRIAPRGLVLLDDASRPGERVVARRWRERWPHFRFDLATEGTKGTLVGTRL
jgi:predicted O-methyltransferase YrrM